MAGDVDGGRDLRVQRRVAVAVAADHLADVHALGVAGQGGRRGPALEGGVVTRVRHVWKWSNSQIESQDCSSARFATAVIASHCSTGSAICARSIFQPCGTNKPKRVVMVYPFRPAGRGSITLSAEIVLNRSTRTSESRAGDSVSYWGTGEVLTGGRGELRVGSRRGCGTRAEGGESSYAWFSADSARRGRGPDRRTVAAGRWPPTIRRRSCWRRSRGRSRLRRRRIRGSSGGAVTETTHRRWNCRRGRKATPCEKVLHGTYNISGWGGFSHDVTFDQNPGDWSAHKGIRFWWYGQNTAPLPPGSGKRIFFEIKDGGANAEASERGTPASPTTGRAGTWSRSRSPTWSTAATTSRSAGSTRSSI